jgi:hypothetical protein
VKKVAARSPSAKRQKKHGSYEKTGDRPQRIVDYKIADRVADGFRSEESDGEPPGPELSAQERTRREQHGRAKTEQKHAGDPSDGMEEYSAFWVEVPQAIQQRIGKKQGEANHGSNCRSGEEERRNDRDSLGPGLHVDAASIAQRAPPSAPQLERGADEGIAWFGKQLNAWVDLNAITGAQAAVLSASSNNIFNKGDESHE